MRTLHAPVILALMTTVLTAERPSAFITDPQQVTSQRKLDVKSFNLEKLYLTRLIGATLVEPGSTRGFAENPCLGLRTTRHLTCRSIDDANSLIAEMGRADTCESLFGSVHIGNRRQSTQRGMELRLGVSR
jgi:hypothetical protein